MMPMGGEPGLSILCNWPFQLTNRKDVNGVKLKKPEPQSCLLGRKRPKEEVRTRDPASEDEVRTDDQGPIPGTDPVL